MVRVIWVEIDGGGTCTEAGVHLRLATAHTPPYASMKHSRDTLKLGSREMLKPA